MRLFFLALAFAACARGPSDGPAEIKWDRDTCRSCGMVISDRHFAAQVQPPTGPIARFDDLGCALKWLDAQPFAADPTVKLWVARHADGAWLDARTARYVSGKTSPMGFNAGAVDPDGGGVDFAAQRSAFAARPDRR